jgi:hypothetical protein
MANPEHLNILRQGVDAWNEWRKKHIEGMPDLTRATGLHGVDLRHAQLWNVDLSCVDLSRTNLSRANLSGAFLISTYLINANLTGANLIGANLSDADLSGADFTDVKIATTSFVHNDLRQVKGLEAIAHHGPSRIDLDTIYKSDGDIPEVFLRGCGVPENFITYVRSLTGHALDFYTCFISFTEADDTFSERLYNDLQAKGVRCWRWKEDAKWGKTLMHSIDEAVRVYDKLIVICSEQSLKSPAVIREIERALQKEDDLTLAGKDSEVLFPIRLDDFIFDGWQHHRKADVVAKTVGDFRQWQQHDSYQKAFDRLLRDLKAGT